jgi:Fur family transcriptional regulator, zinc uptake regulator
MTTVHNQIRLGGDGEMAGEFSRRTKGLLDRAEAVCAHRGAKLTELRRQVLGLVLDAASPLGASDLLDRLLQWRSGAAPPTVYRALDFLLEQGLIHRVERLSAFVGCVAGWTTEQGEGANRTHAAQFLICRQCRKVPSCVTATLPLCWPAPLRKLDSA